MFFLFTYRHHAISDLVSIHGDLFVALEALWERVIKGADDGGSVNDDRLEWSDVAGRHDHIPLHPPVLNCEGQTLITGPKNARYTLTSSF